jgi:hypothetical protein
LYDFTSAVGSIFLLSASFGELIAVQESTDLELQAKQRVLVVEKTSDDWCVLLPFFFGVSLSYPFLGRWTGEINGRSGLFPASYVKLL